MVKDDQNAIRSGLVGDQLPRSPLGHKMMFVILSLLAFGLFAPAVMLPKIREYGQLLVEEQKLRTKVAALNDEVRHRAELAEAFARDEIVNERLAVLDLGYRKPNEEVFSVLAAEPLLAEPTPADASIPRSALLLPDDWPSWTQNAEVWASERGIIDLFLDPALHPIFLLMSGGLIVAAFVLFAPRVNRPRRFGTVEHLSPRTKPAVA